MVNLIEYTKEVLSILVSIVGFVLAIEQIKKTKIENKLKRIELQKQEKSK